METKLTKKYGLVTAICLVIGIVIGSGVFFKAQDVLMHTKGNMPLGIIAWAIGGAIMMICALAFSQLATKYEKVNGVVDYSEATMGNRYAYMMGWFTTTIYYPAMTSVLAWVTARYTLVFFGSDEGITSGLCMSLGAFYLCLSFAINALSPIIAGKLQVSTTFIKLVPLVLMIVVGTIYGLFTGNTQSAFATWQITEETGVSAHLFAAVVATSFAYEGWIIATSINAELKNAKRNLPIALFVGTAIIAIIYILYFVGISGGASIDELQNIGATTAFKNIFGAVGGKILDGLIIISCFGTLNGLMLASTRGMYSVAVRGQGPAPKVFAELSPSTNMPHNSSIVGLLICGAWFFYFYAANLTTPIFGLFSFDSSELPIITIYALYIPIFIKFMIKHGKENKFKNIVIPSLAVIGSSFMVYAAFYAHGISKYEAAAQNGEFSFPVLFYLIVFAVVVGIGMFFYRKNPKND